MAIVALRSLGYTQAFCVWALVPDLGNNLVWSIAHALNAPNQGLAQSLFDFSLARSDFGVVWLFIAFMGCCGLVCEWLLPLGRPPGNR